MNEVAFISFTSQGHRDQKALPWFTHRALQDLELLRQTLQENTNKCH